MYWHETWAITRYLCAWIDAFDTWALCKILRIPYTRHITNADSGQCQCVCHFPTWQWNDAWDSLAISHTVLLMKTITVQLLLRFTSLHQTGNGLQEDPTTRGSEPLNRIWDHWTSVLPTCRRRQPLENTGVRLWTCSRRVYHEEKWENVFKV